MNFKKNKKGFTFIELMIAVFIFALMMLAVTGIFSSSIGGYQKAKNVQKNLEDAQFIMNQMMKILRTSSIISFSASDIKVYDYSSNKCYAYKFFPGQSGGIKVGSASVPLGNKEPLEYCSSSFSPNFSSMAAFYVESGSFYAIPSNPGSGANGVLGKVTIALSICQNSSSCERDQVRIQSSVSLKDYYNAGI
jgi:prepilin-type N-terminal cleavage/methylation domain-containing protein